MWSCIERSYMYLYNSAANKHKYVRYGGHMCFFKLQCSGAYGSRCALGAGAAQMFLPRLRGTRSACCSRYSCRKFSA